MRDDALCSNLEEEKESCLTNGKSSLRFGEQNLFSSSQYSTQISTQFYFVNITSFSVDEFRQKKHFSDDKKMNEFI